MPDFDLPEDEYELSKGQPYSLEEARRIITLSTPHLSPTSINFVGHGMASCAYLVNDAYIFRLPKNSVAAASLKRESCVLPRLKSRLSTRIPEIKYRILEPSALSEFATGYELIKGTPLSQTGWQSMSNQSQATSIRELAKFLTDLHALPPTEFKDCALPEEENRTFYAKYKEYFQTEILPHLSSVERKAVISIFEQYLADERNFQYQPALVHGDMSPDHILIDPDSGKLHGIIDFGDLKITDPDWDLLYLHEDFHADCANLLFSHAVTSTEPERLQIKLKLFKLCLMTIFIREGTQEKSQTKTAMGWRFVRQAISAL